MRGGEWVRYSTPYPGGAEYVAVCLPAFSPDTRASRRRRLMSPDGLQASIEKMRAAGVGDAAIDTFAHYYEQLREGASGMLPESDIEPVEDLPTLDELPEGDPAIVDTAVVLKLNGGLGTSMGMTKAKSLIEAKEGADLPRHRRRPGARRCASASARACRSCS